MSDLAAHAAVNQTCPWSGKPVQPDSLTRYRGYVVGFCNPGCRDKFEAAIAHFEVAIGAPAQPGDAALVLGAEETPVVDHRVSGDALGRNG